MYPIKYFLNLDYQEMEILGIKGLFSNLRVERESLPEGFYRYSLRDGGEALFSSIEKNVLVNHSGDFICKTPFDFGEDDFKDVDYEDWGFTDEPVNLDKFFGVDIKMKVAEALDAFMFDFDTYGYKDTLEIGQENMVDDIRAMLDDRESCEGILTELKEIYEEGKRNFDAETDSLVVSLIGKVNEIVCSFPEKRVELSDQISAAESLKGKSQEDDGQLEREVSDP